MEWRGEFSPPQIIPEKHSLLNCFRMGFRAVYQHIPLFKNDDDCNGIVKLLVSKSHSHVYLQSMELCN